MQGSRCFDHRGFGFAIAFLMVVARQTDSFLTSGYALRAQPYRADGKAKVENRVVQPYMGGDNKFVGANAFCVCRITCVARYGIARHGIKR